MTEKSGTESLEDTITQVVSAATQNEKAVALKKVSRKFYAVCRRLGMRREEILSLATEIIDCFTEDINSLKENVERRSL
ncbi:MAG: hypothetical protein AB9903_06725 [Vulcanimicrobiota bacterium]